MVAFFFSWGLAVAVVLAVWGKVVVLGLFESFFCLQIMIKIKILNSIKI